MYGAIAGAAAAAGAGWHATLSRLIAAPIDELELCRQFDAAQTLEVLLTYAAILPNYVNAAHIASMVKNVEYASSDMLERGSRNPHRLKALTSAVAAHSVRYVKSGTGTAEDLWARILGGLEYDNREVKEIVLQNLITGSFPSPDVKERWDPPQDVIDSIFNIVSSAEQEQGLYSPAAMALVTLCSTAEILRRSGDGSKTARAVKLRARIEQTVSGKALPDRFSYLGNLVYAFFESYGRQSALTFIPRQPTEMLLQGPTAAERQAGDCERFYRALHVVYARGMYEVFRAGSGEHESTVMSSEQAKLAYPKMLEMATAARIDQHVSHPSGVALRSDEKFGEFLREIVSMIGDPQRRPRVDANLQAIVNSRRPLASYAPQPLADSVGSAGLLAIGRAAKDVFAGGAETKLVDAIREVMSRGGKGADREAAGAITAQAANIVLQLSRERGEAMDEREREIGPAEVLDR